MEIDGGSGSRPPQLLGAALGGKQLLKTKPGMNDECG